MDYATYQSQQGSLERRRKLAEALAKQSMVAPQSRPAGRFIAAPSPLEGISRIAQALASSGMMSSADRESQQNAQALGQGRQKALLEALSMSQGGQSVASPMDMGFPTPSQPNPMGAFTSLAQTGDPMLMQAGSAMLGFQGREREREDNQAFRAQQAQMQQQSQAEQAAAAQRAAAERAADAQRASAERAEQQRQLQLQIAQMSDQTRRDLAGRTPQRQPQVIQTAEGPMILGDDGNARPIMGPSGQQVKPSQGRVGPMTATAQKELIETEEAIQGGQAALTLFQQARGLNDDAMGFTGAGAVASLGSLLPSAVRPGAVDATQNLDNILQTAALPQLKAIFGGMPTEGERKILLDVQGSSSKPPAVRKEIFDRAEKAIQARLRFASEKAKRLREGSYFSGDGLPSIEMQPPQANQDQNDRRTAPRNGRTVVVDY